ncbi:RhoGEF domain protein (macronuclear) [Tetrahymena thermophila SB210]|uniref:RhoGEF domain protein n=1 Tax=Tetrahymena thermophila (strain SB210) TaxID=312017 RepID=I7M3F0_TETTS|nr:RhoGEF domain protein [Tetrahymena thermophila SB210]EAS03020.2 RhoGEF domain protein [Tetrahymena thermophila SB210]|eukprot:XP_001023265.2 RhoGEF domain protein [Tetrahymena thermophila SB210]
MEDNPNNQGSDIQQVVDSFSEKPEGEEKEVVNIADAREKAFAKIAKVFIIKHYKNKYQKNLKKAKTRINIIKELVATEKTYTSKLQIIQNTLKSQMMNILNNEQDIQKIFSNIQQILELNQDFLEYIKVRSDTVYSFYTFNNKKYPVTLYNQEVFDKYIQVTIPYFKIYVDYMQNFEVSMQYLEKLKEGRKDIRDYLKQFESENDNISSLLILPVQRIPRYELLFKTLLEKTPTDHKDYIWTQKCLQQFTQVNQQINSQIQKYLDNQKICELSQTFRNFQLNIIENKREFKFEERLYLIKDGEKSCVVSFLNDLILVQEGIDEESTKPLTWLYLNHTSKVKPVEDMKYFTHLFKISGTNNTLTFMAEDEKKKQTLISQIDKIINNLRKDKMDNDLDNIEVNILGTEEWNTTKIQKFTVYVAEIKILNITLKIWVRYRQLSNLEKKIKNHIKDIQIDHFSTRLTWLNSHRTKIIEERKVHFESFLKKILTMKKIKESSIMPEILNDLGLPSDFYDLPYKTNIEEGDKNMQKLLDFDSNSDSDEQKENENMEDNGKLQEDEEINNQEEQKLDPNQQSSEKRISTLGQEFQTRQKSKSNSLAAIGTLSSSEMLKLFRKSKNQRASIITYYNSESLSQNERCLIDVEFLDGSKQEVEINSQSRCFQICASIAKRIKLKSYLDYRIFLKDSKGNFRVLDDDELLFKMLFPHQNSLENNAVLVTNGNRASRQDIILANNQQLLQSLQASGQNQIQDNTQESQNDDTPNPEANDSQAEGNTPLWKYTSEICKNENFIMRTFKRFVSNFSERYTIVFKKYLWLSPQQEEYDIRNDPVRLNLICFQIFENIQQQRYKLSFKNYVLFSALYILIKYPQQAEKIFKNKESCISGNSQEFPINTLKEILPDIIFNSKEETFWIIGISQTLLQINDEIDKIKEKNQSILNKVDLLKSKLLTQSNQKSPKIESQPNPESNIVDISKYTSRQILESKLKLTQLVVINAIKQNKLFGVTQFYVNTYKDTLRDNQHLKENVWLGIKHNMIYVLGPEFKEQIFQFKYEELKATKVFPKLIHLIFESPSREYKFNTTQSFEIKQLITEYQQINQLSLKQETNKKQEQ